MHKYVVNLYPSLEACSSWANPSFIGLFTKQTHTASQCRLEPPDEQAHGIVFCISNISNMSRQQTHFSTEGWTQRCVLTCLSWTTVISLMFDVQKQIRIPFTWHTTTFQIKTHPNRTVLICSLCHMFNSQSICISFFLCVQYMDAQKGKKKKPKTDPGKTCKITPRLHANTSHFG